MVSASSSSRRLKAGILMLAAFAVFVAGAAPLCSSLCCPLAPPQASIHASMPCCAGETSMSRSDAMRVQQTTAPAAPRVHATQPVTIIATATSTHAPALRREPPRLVARHEPSPPLFLLNAQFLI
jgi:hypothetical protein